MLNDDNFNIFKNQVDLNRSIKTLAYEKVRINLHPEVSCEIILNVARSMEEAAKQKQLGKAITNNESLNTEKEKVEDQIANLDIDQKTNSENLDGVDSEKKLTDKEDSGKIS